MSRASALVPIARDRVSVRACVRARYARVRLRVLRAVRSRTNGENRSRRKTGQSLLRKKYNGAMYDKRRGVRHTRSVRARSRNSRVIEVRVFPWRRASSSRR